MADFNNPKNTNPLLNLFGYVRDGFTSLAKMFDGTTDSNVPVGAKKIDGSTKVVSQWNGASWDAIGSVAVATPTLQNPLRTLYISVSGSGDLSGSDSSNKMTWTTFCSEYSTGSISSFPSKCGNVLLYMDSGTYTSGVTVRFKNLNLAIFAVGGAITLSTGDYYFYNCSIFTENSTTLITSNTLSFDSSNIYIYGALTGNVIYFKHCIGNIEAITASGTFNAYFLPDDFRFYVFKWCFFSFRVVISG